MFFSFCFLLAVVGVSCNSATGKNKKDAKANTHPSGKATCKITPELEKNIKLHLVDSYNVPPFIEIKVSAINSTPFDYFDNVTVTFTNPQQGGQTQTQDFYLTKDCNALVIGKVANLTINPTQEVLSKITTEGSPVRGKKDAKVAIVTFSDFQ